MGLTPPTCSGTRKRNPSSSPVKSEKGWGPNSVKGGKCEAGREGERAIGRAQTEKSEAARDRTRETPNGCAPRSTAPFVRLSLALFSRRRGSIILSSVLCLRGKGKKGALGNARVWDDGSRVTGLSSRRRCVVVGERAEENLRSVGIRARQTSRLCRVDCISMAGMTTATGDGGGRGRCTYVQTLTRPRTNARARVRLGLGARPPPVGRTQGVERLDGRPGIKRGERDSLATGR